MERYFSLERFFKVIPLLNEYLPVTLEVAILAVLLGSLAGIFVAFIRVYRIPVLNTFFRGYITLMRGTPFIILMMLVYYYLPYFSWKWFQVDMNTWDKIIFVETAFVLNEAAYMGEIFRGALESVPQLQSEAGHSVGLTKVQTFFRIILPQAVKAAIPTYGQNVVFLFEETSIAFMVGLQDFLGRAQTLSNTLGHQLEAYIYVGLVYAAISIIITAGFKLLDRKFTFGKFAVRL